jgi:polar amino acid transport system substrate-binding protein
MTASGIKQLAPTGTLRGGVVIAPAATTFFAVNEPAGPRGVTVDLLRFFAKRLSLPLEFILFPNSGEATDAVASAECDVAFMPKDAAREARLAFGPAYFNIESAYLVPAGSQLRSLDEVNRAGVRVVAIANTTTMRSARRTAPLASVTEVATVDEMMDMARKGAGDAFALSKDSFAALLPQVPGARVLPGNFQETGICVAVPPGRAEALRLVSDLLTEAKRSGVVRRALDAAGFAGEEVAP